MAGLAAGASLQLPVRARAIVGIFKAPQADYDHADRIISGLPQNSYADTMAGIMNLKDVSDTHSPHERFNQRWARYGNPLIVRFWEQIGYPPRVDDCEAWCATSLSWCLKRDGRPLPDAPDSSHSFLTYGQPTADPVPGDLCVFIDVGDAGRGHVAIFRGFASPDRKIVRILGGNQGSAGGTNCPGGQGQSLVKEEIAPLTSQPHWRKTFGGFRRPPARTV